ncbi:shaggy-related protein kinase alpha-like isoform X2 [Vicia villosa]|uniref:shaggy-related protein kinase alpha-like isoform X2 n=1 Tax=Vicia villosa TaxID=3911 RepID=UPI00273A79C8|nr:shaggy-related protein kinase alpha-like isoform X2 [Vicia villosa]
MKKVLIQNNEQLELVREEIRVSSLFSHPNLLPLLDHAIISVKPTAETSWSHEVYLLFPVHLDGTLLDNAKTKKAKKEHYSTSDVLQIFQQIFRALSYIHRCIGVCHRDIKPQNLLVKTYGYEMSVCCSRRDCYTCSGTVILIYIVLVKSGFIEKNLQKDLLANPSAHSFDEVKKASQNRYVSTQRYEGMDFKYEAYPCGWYQREGMKRMIALLAGMKMMIPL